MSSKEAMKRAEKWLINGGGGHEDGKDGLRALTVSGAGLVEFLAAYDQYVRLEEARWWDGARHRSDMFVAMRERLKELGGS